MIERQLSASSHVTLEVFKRMKPGDQRLYLGKHPHSRYHAFHRKPTIAIPPPKVHKNTFAVDANNDPKEIEKAAADLAENNPQLAAYVQKIFETPNDMYKLDEEHAKEHKEKFYDPIYDPDPDQKPVTDPSQDIEDTKNDPTSYKEEENIKEEEPVDVSEEDNKRAKINKHLDKKASIASTIMWAVIAAGALVTAPLLLPFADLVRKEFGDSQRKDYEKETDKELSYDEFSKQRNKTGRTLTRDEAKVMRTHYNLWKETDGDDEFELRDKKEIVSPNDKDSEEEKKKSTKEYIRKTAAKAITWLADKGMEKLEAKYANMKRLQALQEAPATPPPKKINKF